MNNYKIVLCEECIQKNKSYYEKKLKSELTGSIYCYHAYKALCMKIKGEWTPHVYKH